MAYIKLNSFLGILYITEKNGFISNLGKTPQKEDIFSETLLLLEAKKQLNNYFEGTLKAFNLPLKPEGTMFQQKVWNEMLSIPYGETLSYGSLAENIKSYPRPVGMACGKNPIPIIIPCHRVIAKNDKIGGYSGFNGIEDKKLLLSLEKNNLLKDC
ncbi:MAG: methylated-DNA--[protein]-cysteine S-methyltransferase [Alphaproteobacteria bacterium]